MEKHLHQECSHEHHHEHHHTCSCEHSHEHKEIQVHKKMEKLYITGLDCANCAAKIEEHVKHMENVKEAVLEFFARNFICRSKRCFTQRRNISKYQRSSRENGRWSQCTI